MLMSPAPLAGSDGREAAEPLQIKDGMAIPSSRSGDGLAWNGDVAAKYRLT
jgi:hypothetical protein